MKKVIDCYSWQLQNNHNTRSVTPIGGSESSLLPFMASVTRKCYPIGVHIRLDEVQDVLKNELSHEPLNHRRLMYSKRVTALSFGHYADVVPQRLQNAIARDMFPQLSRKRHILCKRHAFFYIARFFKGIHHFLVLFHMVVCKAY